MGDCDLAELKRDFGHKLGLMGNLHTTDVMLRGSVKDVRRESLQGHRRRRRGRRLHPLHRRPVRPRHARREHPRDGRVAEEFGAYPLDMAAIDREIATSGRLTT